MSRSEGLRKAWARGAFAKRKHRWTDEGRKAQSERMQRLNADPEFARKRREGQRHPDVREGARQRLKERKRDPKFAEAHRTITWQKRDRGAQADVMKRNWANPHFRARQSLARDRRITEKRGGAIPEGYEAEYRRLRVQVGAKEALRMIRLQRGADLRKAA